MQGFFGFLAFVAFVMFIIAMIKPDKVVFWSKKKGRGMGCLYLVAGIVFCIIAGNSGTKGATTTAAGNAGTSSAQSVQANSTTKASTAQSSAAPSSAAPTTQSYSATLLPGFYEIGTDIPAGTYDFEIASGKGNVTDANDDVNLIMGKDSDSMYQKSYKNAALTDGATLTLSQCSIKISSKDASMPLKKRDNSTAKDFAISSSGKYKAGKDFQPGYYDIKLKSGSGNVICEDNELNAIFSTDSSLGVTEYKNVKFEDGNTLDVEGPGLQLTPSK